VQEAPFGALVRLVVNGSKVTAAQVAPAPGDYVQSVIVSPDRKQALVGTGGSSLTKSVNQWFAVPLGRPDAEPQPVFTELPSTIDAPLEPNPFAWE
jgi:hypothetical protein